MHKILANVLLILFLSSSLHSEDLINKYKNMLDSSNYNPETSLVNNKQSTALVNELSNELSSILTMAKNTFESTSDFRKRRNKAITEFEEKEDFFLQNGSQNYSAGSAKMKTYNPDTEIITLYLDWDQNVASLLPECNKFETISFYISREEAKKLFKNKDTHFFHIKVKYINKKLKISEILLYGKYKLYKNVNTQINILKNSNTQHKSSQIKKVNTCTNYRVVANQLNIRNKPQTNSSVLGQINKNELICIYSFENGWAQSKYGWISKKYLVSEHYSEQDFTHNQLQGSSDEPILNNNERNSDSSGEDSSSLPIFGKIILTLVVIFLLISYWRYAIAVIIAIVVYQIFK